mgnify:CR=1 FL=1
MVEPELEDIRDIFRDEIRHRWQRVLLIGITKVTCIVCKKPMLINDACDELLFCSARCRQDCEEMFGIKTRELNDRNVLSEAL